MTRLFDEFARDDERIASHDEGIFRFLNRAPGRYFARVRTLLESWLQAAPSDQRADLRGRLRSSDDRAFSGAFWELYIAQFFYSRGYQITHHPAVGGSERRPDYLATRAAESLYVEATVASSSNDDAAARKRLDWLQEQINLVPSPDFWLAVDIEAQGGSHPPTKNLRSELGRWIESLDTNVVAAALDAGDRNARPDFEWGQEGWRLKIEPIARRRGDRGAQGTTIGMFSPGAGYVDDLRPLRRALREKASRYGQLDRPYLVAVLIQHFFVDDESILNALFGSVAVRFSVDPQDNRVETVRNHDGSWSGPNGPTGTRVSGVFVTRNLMPWSIPRVEPWLVLNPWAKRPFQATLGVRSTSVDLTSGALIESTASGGVAASFGLSSDWPGPEAPFVDELT